MMADFKVFLVKPPTNKRDWDMEDLVKIARATGQELLHTKGHVRVLELERKGYGYVALVVKSGCSVPLVVNRNTKEHE